MILRNSKSLKHRIRSFIDTIAASIGLLAMYERRMSQGLTILMYHRVLPEKLCRSYPLDSLIMPMQAFRDQMRWLAGHCHVLPVCEALVELERGGPFERPLVAVTFDDGYADNAEIAAPILEESGLRGTFFITTGFIEQGEPLWYDRAADSWKRTSIEHRRVLMDELQGGRTIQKNNRAAIPTIHAWMAGLKSANPKIRNDFVSKVESLADGSIDQELYRPMTRRQITQLHKNTHEIASHTVSHPILTQLDKNQLRVELKGSSEKLREWTGSTTAGFCYPNGDVDFRVEKTTKEAGYGYACTTQTGMNQPGNNMLHLSRLSITMQRTVVAGHKNDSLGFRSEICRLREIWRQSFSKTASVA